MLDKLDQALLDLVTWIEARLPGRGDTFLSQIAVAALATFVFLVLWRFVRFVFARLTARVRSWEGTRIPPIRIQHQDIISAAELTELAARIVPWGGTLLVLCLLYVYLNLVFSLFPATQGLADQLFGYASSAVLLVAVAGLNYIPNLIVLAVMFFAAQGVTRIARVIFRGVESKRITLPGFYPEWAQPTFQLVRVLILTFTVVAMFPYLPGHESPAFQAVGLFVGVLVSLGSTGAIANLIAGIVLTYMRPFRVGDRVKIADALGDVIEKTTFVTRIRTTKNVEITIPNAMVMSNHIINFSSRARESGLILHTTVTIGYDVPWQKVRDLLIAAATATADIEAEPPPFVLQTSLDDSYVSYELNAYTRQAEKMAGTYSDLHRNILDRFHAAGVEIMSPHFFALRDGERVNIPDEHLPKDYRATSFAARPLQWLTGTAGKPDGEP